MKKIFIFLLIAMAIVSCAPDTKEAYIEEYKTFISKVSDSWKKYDASDWERMSRKHDKLSGEWFEKFSDELTIKEKTQIATYNAKFNLLRAVNKSKKAVGEAVDDITNKEEKSELEKYIEEDLADDIQEIDEDLGREIEKTGNEMLDELENFFDELGI
ncbi:MAG: hypothetical protein IJA04_08485 [Bacteroidaceae bacterium]|nr:hypothetical protein [Bacteroidaceae bacterium]